MKELIFNLIKSEIAKISDDILLEAPGWLKKKEPEQNKTKVIPVDKELDLYDKSEVDSFEDPAGDWDKQKAKREPRSEPPELSPAQKSHSKSVANPGLYKGARTVTQAVIFSLTKNAEGKNNANDLGQKLEAQLANRLSKETKIHEDMVSDMISYIRAIYLNAFEKSYEQDIKNALVDPNFFASTKG